MWLLLMTWVLRPSPWSDAGANYFPSYYVNYDGGVKKVWCFNHNAVWRGFQRMLFISPNSIQFNSFIFYLLQIWWKQSTIQPLFPFTRGANWRGHVILSFWFSHQCCQGDDRHSYMNLQINETSCFLEWNAGWSSTNQSEDTLKWQSRKGSNVLSGFNLNSETGPQMKKYMNFARRHWCFFLSIYLLSSRRGPLSWPVCGTCGACRAQCPCGGRQLSHSEKQHTFWFSRFLHTYLFHTN